MSVIFYFFEYVIKNDYVEDSVIRVEEKLWKCKQENAY